VNWHLFFSIYALIFIAELPDKTAFATLLLATRSRPVPVFTGVAIAFLVQTIVAVLCGSLIALLPASWVHLGAGLMFFFFSWQMWRSRFEAEGEAEDGVDAHPPFNVFSFWSAAWSAFIVIFIAEWGDLTQLATGSLVAKYPSDKLTVFVAALLALWSVTLVAVMLGRNARRFINPVAIKKYGAFLFAIIGLYFVFTAVRALLGVA
jgi:putative Ca2+/H+ antiporter (TMEM165/GDT1 family)